MTVKEHYDQHLGNFYSWMAGDFPSKVKEYLDFLALHNIKPAANKIAIDLGCGHGIQTLALAKSGFKVQAVDFNKQLLKELANNCEGLNVDIIEADIRNIKDFAYKSPELIICFGDTLTHLEDIHEVKSLLEGCAELLAPEGKLLLSFRDYSVPLKGDDRFIPVKSEENRILTCFLEYRESHVKVTDLLYEKNKNGWHQKVSSYNKIRLHPDKVIEILEKNGLKIIFNEPVSRLATIIAKKA